MYLQAAVVEMHSALGTCRHVAITLGGEVENIRDLTRTLLMSCVTPRRGPGRRVPRALGSKAQGLPLCRRRRHPSGLGSRVYIAF